MKKIVFVLIIFIFGKPFSANSQTIVQNSNLFDSNHIPKEKIFVHYNTSFLLTGEQLNYKVYCLNFYNNSLSSHSKIAYVELIGMDNTPIIKQKIKLNSGLGQGDFLIPTKIQSGNYKLIAYTQSMKNFDKPLFFQSDISIINPFQTNQRSILKKNTLIETENSEIKKENNNHNKKLVNDVDNTYIELKTSAQSFSPRNKVDLSIISLNNHLSYGNYSISVRKIDTLPIPKRLTTETYMALFPYNSSMNSITNKTFFLPELRGELISGQVFYEGSKPAPENIKVALSISGKQFIFKIATTNNLGIFYFNIPEDYENSQAIVQVIHKDRNDFSIKMNSHSSIRYGNLKFYNFRVTPKIKDYVLKRSIYNQIENVYASIKPFSNKNLKPVIPFFYSTSKIYYLDDYTRFPTIKETIIEIIEEVYIKQLKGDRSFKVRVYDQLLESNATPLVLVDGILIQNHNELINFSAKKIKKISVVSDVFIYDSQTFEGIISMETFQGDYNTDLTGNYIKEFSLFRPLEIKNYYKQLYNVGDNSNRIPDYRSQLLWKPNFNFDKNEDSLFFFTSDNTGNYEICLEGFTKNGIPISIRKIITVQ